MAPRISARLKYGLWAVIITLLYIGMLIRYNQLMKLSPGTEKGYLLFDALGTVFYVAAMAATYYFARAEEETGKARTIRGAGPGVRG